MQIHGFSQLTLLDYPGKLSCTIFSGSCNFRCPFCHNASLVLHPDTEPTVDEAHILDVLHKRRSMLEGVCLTGGEPTLQTDLPEFIERLRETGYSIKLDTNGTNPDMIAQLLDKKLVDCIAMDIKSSPEGYPAATGIQSPPMNKIFESVRLIMGSEIDYEFRTTVVDELHSDDDFHAVGKWLEGAKAYFLQRFKDSGDLINASGLHAASKETMLRYCDILLPYIPNTQLRGVD